MARINSSRLRTGMNQMWPSCHPVRTLEVKYYKRLPVESTERQSSFPAVCKHQLRMHRWGRGPANLANHDPQVAGPARNPSGHSWRSSADVDWDAKKGDWKKRHLTTQMLQQSTQCMTIRHSFKKKTMKHSMTRLLRRRRKTRRSTNVNYSTSWKMVREATDIHHSDVSFHSHDAGSGVLPARDQCFQPFVKNTFLWVDQSTT